MFYEGVVIQATNQPADIRIERELQSEYPEVAEAQDYSLRAQVTELYPLGQPHLELVAPARVYHATLHMAAAFAEAVGQLLNDHDLAEPLTRYADRGLVYDLVEAIGCCDLPGYPGDIEAVERWGEILELGNWYQWVPWAEA